MEPVIDPLLLDLMQGQQPEITMPSPTTSASSYTRPPSPHLHLPNHLTSPNMTTDTESPEPTTPSRVRVSLENPAYSEVDGAMQGSIPWCKYSKTLFVNAIYELPPCSFKQPFHVQHHCEIRKRESTLHLHNLPMKLATYFHV